MFVHLKTHTEYSLIDGIVRIEDLMPKAREMGMPAIALSDHNNMFALVKFYKAALSAGLKPILGADVWLAPDNEQESPTALTIFCLNNQGYQNLSILLSKGWLEGQRGDHVLLKKAWLAEYAEHLLVLNGGRAGKLAQLHFANRPDSHIQSEIDFFKKYFENRFYLEIQRIGHAQDENYNQAAIQWAQNHDLPLVATHNVRFIEAEDFEAHETRVCIYQGYTLDDARRPKQYTPDQYFKSPEEMAQLFADVPEALQNTVEISKRCTVDMVFGKNVLPDYPVPEGMDAGSFLAQQAHLGLDARLIQQNIPESQYPIYKDRLDFEIQTIIQMGFPGYFLIVADFIQWSKNNGVPVGPGRGSGAGSLVAYALQITDLNPLPYDLLFERFLNPERVSMPDFDIDFCMDGRDRVIDYVAQKYGRERVSQIITYGSMAAKGVIRDVGRVFGHPYGFVDKIAKLIPNVLDITLELALQQSPELKQRYDEDEEVRELLDTALKLEGLARNVGKHAGGVVIAPSQITDFAPIYCEADGSNPVTQFDKDDVEAVGLVKFDFLGLKTLTIINKALNLILKNYPEIQKENLLQKLEQNFDDKSVYEKTLKSGESIAVFQLESSGMRRILRDLAPDNFEDIIALVALYRPGPLQSGMVADFINRKHGRAAIEYPHPSLETVLKPTYGTIVYQEQVMQIAQVLSGYSLGGADLLRRAMGKKKPEEMAKERGKFVSGAIANDINGEQAGAIFDLVEKFAGYGFNKSHSAAYALLTYQTAWLKTHYPAEYLCATLSADMTNTDKVVLFQAECKRLNIQILPPDIQAGAWEFTVVDAKTLRYGLGAVKGVGEAAILNIMAERATNGKFVDLVDFCCRLDLRKVNRRVLDALLACGALDGLGENRATLTHNLENALAVAVQFQEQQAAGQNDLFAIGDNTQNTPPKIVFKKMPDWSLREKLKREKEVLGVFLSGHPLDEYRDDINQIIGQNINQCIDKQPDPTQKREGGGRMRGQTVVLVGLVGELRARPGKRVIFMLEDGFGQLECSLSEDKYPPFRDLLNSPAAIVVKGSLAWDDYIENWRLTVQQVLDLQQVRAQCVQKITAIWHKQMTNKPEQFIQSWRAHLANKPSQAVRVIWEYHFTFGESRTGSVELQSQKPLPIGLDEDFSQFLNQTLGKNQWKLGFKGLG